MILCVINDMMMIKYLAEYVEQWKKADETEQALQKQMSGIRR